MVAGLTRSERKLGRWGDFRNRGPGGAGDKGTEPDVARDMVLLLDWRVTAVDDDRAEFWGCVGRALTGGEEGGGPGGGPMGGGNTGGGLALEGDAREALSDAVDGCREIVGREVLRRTSGMLELGAKAERVEEERVSRLESAPREVRSGRSGMDSTVGGWLELGALALFGTIGLSDRGRSIEGTLSSSERVDRRVLECWREDPL